MANYNTTRTGQWTRKISTPRIHDLVVRHLAYVEGLENIPRTGPVVFVANHSSYMDHFVMKTVVDAVHPGRVWFPTKAEAFETFLSRVWHESMDCYPVDRNAPGEEVFLRAREVLDRNDTLVLYPEGTRNTGEGLLPFKTGAFRIALANKAPVIPVGLSGLSDVLPKGASIPRRRLLSVAIGKPLAVPSGCDERTAARQMRDEAFDRISGLKFRAARINSKDHGQALCEMVALSQQMVTENLSENGLLSPAAVNRIGLLLKIADATSDRRLDLKVQQTRLGGFRALNSTTALGKMFRAAMVNQKASRLSDQHSSYDFAAYLAGRSALVLPRWLGGGPNKALTHFRRAADREGRMASQSYVGLAEAWTASGRNDCALDAYEQAKANIDSNDPRGAARKERINAAIQRLDSAVKERWVMVVSFVQRHVKIVAFLWVILFILGGIGAFQLNGAVKAGGFNDQNGQSFLGQEVNRKAFGDAENELSVVLKSDREISQSELDDVAESIKELPHVVRVADGRDVKQLVSESGHTQIVQVGIDADNTTTQNMVPTLRDKVENTVEGAAIQSHVTGAAALDYDLNIQSQLDALHAEMIAFPLLIVVLLVIYRSLGPTLVTLTIAGVCLAGTQGIGTLLSKFMDVSNMYITGASLIGLAVSVDYCLFLIARYKENLQSGSKKSEALQRATQTAGHAIRFGELSVIAALCALFIARNMVFSSIALAGIIVTTIALLALSTLVPALITLLGDKLFFGRLPGFDNATVVRGEKDSPVLRGALARPAVVALAVVIPLALAAVPLAGIKLQVPVASAGILPKDKDSRLGMEAIQSELDARSLFPTSVTIEGAPGESASDVQQRAAKLVNQFQDVRHVDQVLAPGTREASSSPYPLTDAQKNVNYARVMVTSTGLPDSDEAHEMIDDIKGFTDDQPGVYVSGATAQGYDFDQLVEKSIPWIVATVLIISLALLGWAFRSWRLPLLAVVLNGLVVSAAMGLLSLL
jgi:RND superfamily drug exporter